MLSKLLQDELHYSSDSKARGPNQHLAGNIGSVVEQKTEDMFQQDLWLYIQREILELKKYIFTKINTFSYFTKKQQFFWTVFVYNAFFPHTAVLMLSVLLYTVWRWRW